MYGILDLAARIALLFLGFLLVLVREKRRAKARGWWIHAPFVKASGNPTDQVLRLFRAQGFTQLISLLDEQRERPAYDVPHTVTAGWTRSTFAIQEGEAPTVEQLLKILGTIRAVPQTKTIVHCSTGLGRAATIGAAYWIEAGLSPLEAVAKISDRAGCSFLTADRARVLTELAVRDRAP